MDTLTRPVKVADDEIAVNHLRHERRERRNQMSHRHENIVEHDISSDLVGIKPRTPESFTRTANIPVRQIICKSLESSRCRRNIVHFQLCIDFADQ